MLAGSLVLHFEKLQAKGAFSPFQQFLRMPHFHKQTKKLVRAGSRKQKYFFHHLFVHLLRGLFWKYFLTKELLNPHTQSKLTFLEGVSYKPVILLLFGCIGSNPHMLLRNVMNVVTGSEVLAILTITWYVYMEHLLHFVMALQLLAPQGQPVAFTTYSGNNQTSHTCNTIIKLQN